MPIPLDTIRLNIKEKRITRINQVFEYGTIPEWKEAIGFRKGLLERLIEDPARFEFRHIWKIHIATDIPESAIRRLVEGQRKHNWAMKRAVGRKDGPGEPQPGD